MFKKITLVISSVLLASSCMKEPGWNVSNHYDEFTESKSCRVEYRDGFTGIGVYFSYIFYAENKDGEVRAGVRTEPSIPIAGDIQIKVGEKLVTMTLADTPLDVAQKIAAANDSIKQMTDTIQRTASPYRAFKGQKATDLLKDMAATSGEIKYRVVGINSAVSSTGTIKTGENFTKALKACEINLY